MTKTSRHLQSKGALYDVFADDLVQIRERAYDIVSRLSHVSMFDTETINELVHKLVGSFGKDSKIVPPFRCDYGENIYIGNNSFIDYNCCFLDAGVISIGEHVYIGPNCCIFTPCHPIHYKLRWDKITEYADPVEIGSHTWIAGDVVITPGVKIGEGCVIGAGSVVTKSIPPYSLAMGNPCKVVGKIDKADKLSKQAIDDINININVDESSKDKSNIYKQEHGFIYDTTDKELYNKRVDSIHNINRLNRVTNKDIQRRRDLIRTFMPDFGEGSVLMSPFYLEYADHLEVGKNCYINYDCTMKNSGKIKLGDNVLIAPKVSFYTSRLPFSPSLRKQGLEQAQPITVEDNVWIGGSAIILGGVTIGKNAIVGAGAVVTHDVPADTIVVGNPAKVLRKITAKDIESYHEAIEKQSQNSDINTEFDKMLSGYWYNCMDSTLVKMRGDSAKKIEAFNKITNNTMQYKDRVAKAMLNSYGENAMLLPPFIGDYGTTISIGENTVVNHSSVFVDTNKINIGKHVLIGPKAGLYCATHPFDAQARSEGMEASYPIEIGDGTWLGGKVTVVPGIKIGKCSVIGAGSVVTKDIPDNVVAAGNPCRVIRSITEQDYDKPIRKR